MATHTESAAEDRQDMQRLVQGVDAALDTLMQRHGAPIIRYLHRMVGDEEEANDLAQETFARIYQHRSRFDPQQVFSTWAYTIAGNLARDFLRRRKRRPTDSLEAQVAETNLSLRETIPDGHPLAPDQLQAREQRIAVRRAVANLSEDLREAVVLCELEDQPIVIAAAILKTTPKAIESRLYRARKLLRSQLKSWL